MNIYGHVSRVEQEDKMIKQNMERIKKIVVQLYQLCFRHEQINSFMWLPALELIKLSCWIKKATKYFIDAWKIKLRKIPNRDKKDFKCWNETQTHFEEFYSLPRSRNFVQHAFQRTSIY